VQLQQEHLEIEINRGKIINVLYYCGFVVLKVLALIENLSI
jgi:hypothetical protein